MKWALHPIASAYGAVIRARNARYDAGRGVSDVGCPVVSVGNVTVGGTGKTPMVQWLARELRQTGRHPAIAMRGYGRAGGRSDEAMEHASSLPDVPVLVHPDRVRSIAAHRQGAPECDVIVLDDGFQHRRVARNMDVVLVDARQSLAAARLLPVGRLREPLTSLARATDVVVTHAADIDGDLSAAIERYHGGSPIAWCRHVWAALTMHDGGDSREVAVDALRGMNLVTRLGIAHPSGVLSRIRACGGAIAADLPARDHAPVTAATMRAVTRAVSGADALFLTRKDWVKFRGLIDWDRLRVPVIVPRLELEFLQGRDLLTQRLHTALERT